MKLSERWRAFCKPYLDRWMTWARKDPDVSLQDYEKLKQTYEKIYK